MLVGCPLVSMSWQAPSPQVCFLVQQVRPQINVLPTQLPLSSWSAFVVRFGDFVMWFVCVLLLMLWLFSLCLRVLASVDCMLKIKMPTKMKIAKNVKRFSFVIVSSRIRLKSSLIEMKTVVTCTWKNVHKLIEYSYGWLSSKLATIGKWSDNFFQAREDKTSACLGSSPWK